jgi:protein-S-isoprenylcysteine O-methyltransferase Ste14
MGTVVLVLTSALWGALHSLLASNRVKAAAERVVGLGVMRWYRLLYNGVALVTFLPLVILMALLPDRVLYTIPAAWLYLTLGLQAIAAGCLLAALLQTNVFSFLGLNQPFGGDRRSEKLFSGGLYRYVRHPLYTSGLVILWLAPEMTVNRLVLVASLSLYTIVGALFEERKLERQFGSEYTAYKARTPMFLPRLWPSGRAANYSTTKH